MTSQASALPLDHGMRVAPSGLFPPCVTRPVIIIIIIVFFIIIIVIVIIIINIAKSYYFIINHFYCSHC